MNEVGTIPEEKEVLKSEVKYGKTMGRKCDRSLEEKGSVGEEVFRDERIILETSLSLVNGKVDNSTEDEVLQFIESLRLSTLLLINFVFQFLLTLLLLIQLALEVFLDLKITCLMTWYLSNLSIYLS